MSVTREYFDNTISAYDLGSPCVVGVWNVVNDCNPDYSSTIKVVDSVSDAKGDVSAHNKIVSTKRRLLDFLKRDDHESNIVHNVLFELLNLIYHSSSTDGDNQVVIPLDSLELMRTIDLVFPQKAFGNDGYKKCEHMVSHLKECGLYDSLTFLPEVVSFFLNNKEDNVNNALNNGPDFVVALSKTLSTISIMSKSKVASDDDVPGDRMENALNTVNTVITSNVDNAFFIQIITAALFMDKKIAGGDTIFDATADDIVEYADNSFLRREDVQRVLRVSGLEIKRILSSGVKTSMDLLNIIYVTNFINDFGVSASSREYIERYNAFPPELKNVDLQEGMEHRIEKSKEYASHSTDYFISGAIATAPQQMIPVMDTNMEKFKEFYNIVREHCDMKTPVAISNVALNNVAIMTEVFSYADGDPKVMGETLRALADIYRAGEVMFLDAKKVLDSGLLSSTDNNTLRALYGRNSDNEVYSQYDYLVPGFKMNINGMDNIYFRPALFDTDISVYTVLKSDMVLSKFAGHEAMLYPLKKARLNNK